MYFEYVQSREDYKGFVLEIVVYRHEGHAPHRRCFAYKDGERISCSKTKKELKELIDLGYM